MSDVAPTTDAARRLTADELAEAIREGLEARDWRFDLPAPPFPPPELDPAQVLPPVGNLAAVPVPRHPGVRGRLAWAGRRLLRGLLKPWADQQTRFNDRAAHLMHQQSVQLARRGDETAARLQARVDELTRAWFETARRLSELEARVGAGGP